MKNYLGAIILGIFLGWAGMYWSKIHTSQKIIAEQTHLIEELTQFCLNACNNPTDTLTQLKIILQNNSDKIDSILGIH